VVYVNQQTPIEVGCLSCGVWKSVKPKNHLDRNTNCANCRKLAYQDLSQLLLDFQARHGDVYNYSRVVWKPVREKVEIGCPCGHWFHQAVAEHKRGNGCPRCARSPSEILFGDCLSEALPNVVVHMGATFDWLINPKTNAHLELDFYIPSMNIAFEVQGRQHYEEVRGWKSLDDQQHRDTLKRTLCEARGIVLYEYDLREGRDKSSMGLWLKGVL